MGPNYYPVWLDLIYPYTKSEGVGNCPSANNPDPKDFPGHIDYHAYTRYVYSPPSNHYTIPYGMPETMGLYPGLTAGNYRVRTLAEFQEPTKRIMLAEAVKYAMKDPWQAPFQYGHLALRHGDGIMVGFMDGHAKVVPWRPLLKDCTYWFNVGDGLPSPATGTCQ
jgi:prepilin-type processing-associated H-X9-DG protein